MHVNTQSGEEEYKATCDSVVIRIDIRKKEDQFIDRVISTFI